MYFLIGGDGKEYGPKSAADVREWIAEGRLNAQSQIKPQGESDWVQLGSVQEFAADLNPRTPAPLPALPPLPEPNIPPASTPASSPHTAPLPPVGYAPHATTFNPTNGMAIAGMIMGILSILSTYPCCGIPFNILGIIFSLVALSQIKSNPMQDGKGMAIAGLVCSILSFLLILVLVLLGVAIGITNP